MPDQQPYTCPAHCDPDCEINGWGCHEAHDEPKRREHDADACEARMLAGNLRWLLDAQWKITLGRHPTGHQGENGLEPYYAEQVGNSMFSRLWHGVSPGDAIARALQYAEQKQGEAPGEH